MEYRLQVDKHSEKHFPNADEVCGRIGVILASNGSGKTKLLDYWCHSMTSRGKGNRYLKIDSNRVVLDELNNAQIASAYGTYGTPQKAEASYKSTRGGTLKSRIRFSLMTLQQRDKQERDDYLISLRDWDVGGRKGDSPKEQERILDTTFRLFTSVFPYIEISLNESEQLYLKQKGATYNIGNASDGERQVFALIADIILNNEPDFTIIVDEPEAHLNPLLANQVWDVIENYLPKAQFIYATHSISFALRSNVNSLFGIDKVNNKLVPFTDIRELSYPDQADLLGAIPAILSANKVIGVEGTDTSFDMPFYTWLVGDDVKVVSLGGHKEVLDSTKKLTIWKEIAPSCRILGVIDRDHNDNEIIGDNILMLDQHEAESYLCLPSLLSQLAAKTFANPPTLDDLTKLLVNTASTLLLDTAFARVSFKTALPRTHLSKKNIDTSSLANIKVGIPAFIEKQKNAYVTLQSNLPALIDKEYDTCSKAIINSDIPAILNLFPGKELLRQLSTAIGYATTADLLDSARKHISFSDWPHLTNLRLQILSKLNQHSQDSITSAPLDRVDDGMRTV